MSSATLDVIGGGITLSMWVNPETYMFNDTRTISKATGTGSDDHWWMVSTNGSAHVLRFRLKTDDGQSATTLIADSGGILEGEWTHVAATWDGSTMRLYRNQELVGSTAKGGTAVAVDPTVAAAMGNQPLDAGDKHWVGLIDEVRIYNRGLAAGELLYIASGQ